ncbi:MAG: TIGR01777 family oxidoreductase [Acidimicrobiales bacterium]|nr:TIGR01777 family oxidoreductase [Acidimicrobiales bacterium]
MRIAITGSSGLIGTALRASLAAGGHEAVPIVRGAPRPGAVSWDPDAGRLDGHDLEGLDGVVHLAGESIGAKRWSPAQKAKVLESRTKGTQLLCAALGSLDQKPPVLVSGSAIGFYGDRGDEPLTEESAPGSGFLAELCLAWEAAAAPAEAAGIRVAKVRTGIVLTPEGGALGKMLPLFKLGVGGRLGSGRQWMSWISLVDEVGAIRFLLEHDVAGPVNLTAPAPVTNAAFTKALGKAVHRPTLLPVPSFGPRLLLGRELAEEVVLAGQRVLPEVLLAAGFEFRHRDVHSALQAVFTKEPVHA